MNDHPFLKRLKQSVIVADGAMGTMVQQLSDTPVDCIEGLNLSNPDLVGEIHRQYVQAGSLLSITNTFAANRFSLEREGCADRVKEVNTAGVALARAEVRGDGFVAGSMGPFAGSMREEADLEDDELEAVVREQAGALLKGGVDCFLLETYPSVNQLLRVLRIVRDLSDIPVITSLTVSRAGTTYEGMNVVAAARQLVDTGAAVIGLNCGYGVQALETALEQLSSLQVPLSAMPNAGLPQRVGGRIIYGVSEEYFARKAERFVEWGVRIIGGCCGTTPAHIEAVAALLRRKKIVRTVRKKMAVAEAETDVPFKDGAFLKKAAERKLPVICEIDPPGTFRLTKTIDAIKSAVTAGADAVSMAENPLATIKINNLAFSEYVRKEVDTEVILHVTGRDRNLLGQQSFLLGCHLLGVSGLLMVTGDPSHLPAGPTNVYDTGSVGLIKMAAALNRGKDLHGKDLGTATDFSIAGAVNPNAGNLAAQLKHLRNKVQAGARFVLTQPMFEAVSIRAFLDRTADLGVPVYIGIFPIISSRNAEYLHHEVPGITVPEELRRALADEPDKEKQAAIGMEWTRKLIAETAEELPGLYLIAPHARPGALADVVSYVRETLKIS